MKKYVIFVCMLLSIAMLLTGCATLDNFKTAVEDRKASQQLTEQAPETIKIGVFEPLTGEFAQAASEEVAGMQFANKLYSEALGKKVELVYSDNQSDASVAVTAAQTLVDAKVSCILGSYKNTLAMAGEDVFTAARIPAIAATCTNPIITQTSDYYFRVCIVDAFQGNSIARFFTEYCGVTNVAVMKQASDDKAASTIEEFTKKMQSASEDAHILSLEFESGTTDYSTYFQQLVEAEVQYIFLSVDSTTADEIIYQAYTSGYTFYWVGTTAWEDITTAAASALKDRENLDYLEGVSFVSYFDSGVKTTSVAATLLRAYQSEYPGQTPSQNFALGFDAYLLALDAIKRAEKSDDGIFLQAILINTKNFEGATGLITMNEYGDPNKDVIIETISGGNSVATFTATPEFEEDAE